MDPELLDEYGIHFTARKHAILKGYILVFNKIFSKNPKEGKSNIIPQEGGVVEGIYYEVDTNDYKKLDSKEGYPRHYLHDKYKVTLDSGEEVEAMAHMANPEMIGEGLKPTKKHIAIMLKAKDLLPPEYIKKLEQIPTLD